MDVNPLSGTTAALREAVPNLVSLLPWLDYVGVGVFAVTGALVGAKSRQDIVTCAFFAVLTGVGGGTVRDLLIGARVFWIERAGYLEVCLIAAAIVFVLSTDRWPERVLTWLDAIGLAVYCVIGTLKALAFGAGPIAAVAMGVATASVGGIMRDVVAMRPSILLNREFYITAAIAGSGVTVLLLQFDVDKRAAGAVGSLVAFCTRAGTILFGWKQPEKRG